MGLILMGYGHLTIITMGLGYSMLDSSDVYLKPKGEVLFTNKFTDISMDDKVEEIDFETKSSGTDFEDDITGVQDGTSYWHRESVVTALNWEQFELRFEEVDGDRISIIISGAPTQPLFPILSLLQITEISETNINKRVRHPDRTSNQMSLYGNPNWTTN